MSDENKNQDNQFIHNRIRDLKRRIEITRDIRFKAANGLSKRNTTSMYIISTLSLYVIGIALIPTIFRLETYQNAIISALSIVLSIFIIFTSIIEGTKDHRYLSRVFHECASKLVTLNIEIRDINTDISEDRLCELTNKYNFIIEDCKENHDDVYYYKIISERPDLFPKEYNRGLIGNKITYLKYLSLAFVYEYRWMFFQISSIIASSIIIYIYIIRVAEFI